MAPLRVNEMDYGKEEINNHVLRVWNSSNISLDLEKLHNQMKTMEHS